VSSFLADTSVWTLAKLHPPLGRKLIEKTRRRELVTTAPVALELLHSARDGDEYKEAHATLDRLRWLALTPGAADRALDVQRSLAHVAHGAHRLPAIDYVIAAVAETSGAILWHLDRDLARLCEHTGQPHEHERLSRRVR
jgi:predicted nucleic acid-binding protein